MQLEFVLVDKMNKKIKKIAVFILGVLIAIIFSMPYLAFRNEVQDMATLGYIGLILSCAISNVTILLPSSSTLIVLAAATTLNPVLCILCGGIGTSIGEQASYALGRIGRLGIDDKSIKEKRIFEKVREHSFLTIFIFAFVPLPVFDIVGIASGVLKVNWLKYATAAVLGKTLKFTLAVIGVFYILPNIVDMVPPPFDKLIQNALDSLNI